MRTLAPFERGMAVLLAALAGYIDSLGFLQLGGLFVSFMSGNSTRMAVGVSMGDWRTVGVAAAILGLFVLGAALGALVAGGEGMRSRSRVLTLEAALLAVAALAVSMGLTPLAVGLMVLAMGIENAVFLRDGEVGVGLTYMTGALVKLGQALAGALRGGHAVVGRSVRRGGCGRLQLWCAGAERPLAGGGAGGGPCRFRPHQPRGVNFRITPEKVISSRSPVVI